MACNAPGLPEESESPSLEVGAMSDLGKLVLGSDSGSGSSCTWTMYIDMHPVRMSVSWNGTALGKCPLLRMDNVKNRLRWLLTSKLKHKNNALIIGGHGMPYAGGSEYWPVDKEDGVIGKLTIRDIADVLKETLREKLDFLVLDSCCLSNWDDIVILSDYAMYICAYQECGPWNGFITHKTMELWKGKSLQEFLEVCLDDYKQRAEDEELDVQRDDEEPTGPSPMVLINTAAVENIRDMVEKMKDGSEWRVDLLSYGLDHVDDKEKFKELIQKLIVKCVTPKTFKGCGEDKYCGVSLFL